MSEEQDEYYSEFQVLEIIGGNDMESLKEYLYGWKDAIIYNRFKKEFYRKQYVDMYINHNN